MAEPTRLLQAARSLAFPARGNGLAGHHRIPMDGSPISSRSADADRPVSPAIVRLLTCPCPCPLGGHPSLRLLLPICGQGFLLSL